MLRRSRSAGLPTIGGRPLARGLPDSGKSGAEGAKMRQFVSIRRNGSLAGIPTLAVFLAILGPAAAFLAALWWQPWLPRADLIEVVASVGSLLWIGAASICLFTAVMIHAAQGERARSRFLLAAALVTLWLGLDDVYAIHEEILPWLGIPGPLARSAYVALGALYLLVSWRLLLSNRPTLLLAAGVVLGASLQAEVFAGTISGAFVQAALKFLAVAFWAGFHVAAAARMIEELATGRITTVALPSQSLVRKTA